jgi:hypothetical protein
MSEVRKVTTFEVCDASVLDPVLDLGAHPLCDDLVPIGKPDVCNEYPIKFSSVESVIRLTKGLK